MKTLGIISPSWGPAKYYPERLKKAIKNAKKLGFNIKFMKYSLNSNGYISDIAEHRAYDFMEAFRDPEVDIVMTMIGGNHSNQILKYIDWEVLKSNPKPFVGYSDITVLHHAIYTKTGLKTYYGPAFISQFGDIDEEYKYTFQYFNKIIIEKQKNIKINPSLLYTDDFVDWGDQLNKKRKFKENKGWKWIKKGKAIGLLNGGCIPSISHLFGTEYFIDTKDKIFFIDISEDYSGPEKGLDISHLDSYFADLDNIGIFNNIKGLIIGRPYKYVKEEIKQLENLILHYTKNKNYPILFGVDIGHTDPMLTIQYNSNVKLDSKNNLFILNYNKNA